MGVYSGRSRPGTHWQVDTAAGWIFLACVQVPVSTAWLLRPDQGRSTLGKVLQSMRTPARKRRVLHSPPGVFPWNAILFKWKLADLTMCLLCAGASESLAHISADALHSKTRTPTRQPCFGAASYRHHGGTARYVATSSSVEAPLECHDMWQRVCDELAESD